MISVCMATYNGEKYIKEQLDSILCQLNIDDEVIISDDGSTDATIVIIESYQDNRIVLFKNSFKNVVRNFEFVINQAKGEYVFLSDQDDIWHQDKVKEYIENFTNNTEVSLIISDLQIIDKNDGLVDRQFYKKGFTDNFTKNIIANNFIGCSMAFKSNVKKTILPFPKNIAMHDWWIGTCCIISGKVRFVDEKLNYYRRHDNNVTKEGGANLVTKIKWRINLLWNLMIRFYNLK
jgi:glycosyltransferase involved in cell wall biosynthesis